MSKRKNSWIWALAGVAALSVTMAGCRQPVAVATPSGGAAPQTEPYKPPVDAGFKVDPIADPNVIKGLVASKSFRSRTDPFALQLAERRYDQNQLAERVASESGWTVEVSPPVDTVVIEQDEPQPYRRLAGVIQSDTVSAIIIMEDGRAEIIRPGMMIPNTEWRVVSIDEEKAVLRRAGNKRPRQITVRLESDLRGAGGGGGMTGSTTGGQPGQPDPGAPRRPGPPGAGGG